MTTSHGRESLGLVKAKVEKKLPKVVRKGDSISDGYKAAAGWGQHSANFKAYT